MKTKGFTLVELLVVIAILAILATVSVVGYTSYIQNANASVAEQEASQIKTAILAEDIVNDNFSIAANGTITGVDAEDIKAGHKTIEQFETYLNTVVSGTVAFDEGATTVTVTSDTHVATIDLSNGKITVEPVTE